MMQLGPTSYGKPVRWSNVVTVNTAGPVPITNPVGQFQLLPMPEDNVAHPQLSYVLRFEGMAPLSPLIAPTDSCIIDSKAIVLFAAAEMLATQKSEAAPMKLTKAQNYLRRLLADQGADKRAQLQHGRHLPRRLRPRQDQAQRSLRRLHSELMEGVVALLHHHRLRGRSGSAAQ